MTRECCKCTNTASHVLNFCPQHLPPNATPAPAPPADEHDPCEVCGDPIGQGAPSMCNTCVIRKRDASKAPPADDGKWLDAPSEGDGWYWMTTVRGVHGVTAVFVQGPNYLGWNSEFSGLLAERIQRTQWQRIPVPAPPAPPLPASRSVTLTAKVDVGPGDARAYVYVNGEEMDSFSSRDKKAVFDWVRDAWGIEPTVEGEPA